jgi:hypothetical protein
VSEIKCFASKGPRFGQMALSGQPLIGGSERTRALRERSRAEATVRGGLWVVAHDPVVGAAGPGAADAGAVAAQHLR